MLIDYLWGIGTKLSNKLQKYGFLTDSTRGILRNIAHIFISDPIERVIDLSYGF